MGAADDKLSELRAKSEALVAAVSDSLKALLPLILRSRTAGVAVRDVATSLFQQAEAAVALGKWMDALERRMDAVPAPHRTHAATKTAPPLPGATPRRAHSEPAISTAPAGSQSEEKVSAGDVQSSPSGADCTTPNAVARTWVPATPCNSPRRRWRSAVRDVQALYGTSSLSAPATPYSSPRSDQRTYAHTDAGDVLWSSRSSSSYAINPCPSPSSSSSSSSSSSTPNSAVTPVIPTSPCDVPDPDPASLLPATCPSRKSASQAQAQAQAQAPTLREPPTASLFSLRCNARNKEAFVRHFRHQALGERLLLAIKCGSTRHVRRLLEAGADANYSTEGKWTLLHRVAASANAEFMALLLKAGANLDPRSSYGYTPLHMATYHDYSGSCVELLVSAGAQLEARNRSGRTPLHYAAECGNEEGVRLLLAAGADAEAKDDAGQTPCDLAALEGVRRLLQPSVSKRRSRPRLKRPPSSLQPFHF